MKIEACPFCEATVETNHPGYYIHEENDCFLSGYEFDEEFIPQWNRRADGWVSVSDGLPADGQQVLFQHGDEEEQRFTFGYFNDLPSGRKFFKDRYYEYNLNRVIRWHERPEVK